MARTKSFSNSSTPSSPPMSPSLSSSSSSHGTPFGTGNSTRTLKKTSSFADLAKRQLRKFRSKGDFDFGCQGDSNQEIVEEEESEAEQQQLQEMRAPLPFPSSSASSPIAPPSRPPAPFEPLDESQFTPDQLRNLRRQKEEALAASACLEYIQTTKTHQHQHRRQHSRTHSRSSSLSNPFHLSPALERLNLHDRDPTMTPSSHSSIRPEGKTHGRSDSGSSVSSSLCSSRPRTNDSLPSFASSDAITCSSAGSYPPSPIQTSRPTFQGGGGIKKIDHSSIDPALQPRAYAFI
ncbi:hypothetical protein JCM3765_000633 [Sporobolomyces pararoseus]